MALALNLNSLSCTLLHTRSQPPSTPKIGWSRRLNDTPRQFLVNNEQVNLVDTGDKNRAVVWVLNGANGDLIHELRPACTFPNTEMRAAASEQYLVTEDGAALLVVGSGTYACMWRYNLTDGALTWGYTAPGVHSPCLSLGRCHR